MPCFFIDQSNATMPTFESKVAPMATSTFSQGGDFPKLSSVLPPLEPSSRRIYMLRHGETEWNVQGKIQGGGRYDIPLNENGRAQAMAVAKAMEDIPLTLIASSTLSRAKETADILWRTGHESCHRIMDPGFKGMNLGEYEGQEHRILDADPRTKGIFKKISERVKEDIHAQFPGGESTAQLQERSVKALYKVLQDFPSEKHIAIVSHRRTNKVLMASTALNDVRKFATFKQSNTCINVVDVAADGTFKIQVENFIDHVKDNVLVDEASMKDNVIIDDTNFIIDFDQDRTCKVQVENFMMMDHFLPNPAERIC